MVLPGLHATLRAKGVLGARATRPVLAAPRGGAGEGKEAARPQETHNLLQRLVPLRVVLEALCAHDGAEHLIGKGEGGSLADHIHVGPGGNVIADVTGRLVKQIAVIAIDITRPDIKDHLLLKKLGQMRADKLHKVTSLGVHGAAGFCYRLAGRALNPRAKSHTLLRERMAAAAAGEESPIYPRKGRTMAYFCFGRFNPPTIGHRAMIEYLINEAAADKADAYVFATSTQDSKKNPLFVQEKVELLRMMFPDTDEVRIIDTTETKTRTLGAAFGALKHAGYTTIVLFAGSDRVADFTGQIEGLEVVSAGERDANGENVADPAAWSATRARAAAIAKNRNTFRAGINRRIGDAKLDELMVVIPERLMPKAKTAGKSKKATEGGGRQRKRQTQRRRRRNKN